MKIVVALVCVALIVIGCAFVTVQTNTGTGTVGHDADKGAVIIKPTKMEPHP